MNKISNQLDDKTYQIFSVFRDFVKKANALKDVKWVLAGSLASYLHGLEVEPKDIDILTNKRGAEILFTVLSDDFEVVKEPEWGETELYASYYSKYRKNDVNLEIIGDFELKTEHGKINIPFIDIWNMSEYFRSTLGKFKVVPLELQLLYNIFIPDKANRVEMILSFLKEKFPNFRIIREIKKVVNPFVWQEYTSHLSKIIDLSEI